MFRNPQKESNGISKGFMHARSGSLVKSQELRTQKMVMWEALFNRMYMAHSRSATFAAPS
eukprot:3934361-Rhodomonas_salina.1